MFVKNVKKFFARAGSITTRLTLFYSIATFILLMGITLILYVAMVGILYQNDRQFLMDEIHVVQYLLQRKTDNFSVIQHEIHDVPLVLNNSIYHYSIRIIDERNKVVYETPGMRDALSGAEFFNKNASSSQLISKWWRAKNGDKYLLMQSLLKVKKNAKPIWLIQAALDVSYQHATIERYRTRALTVLIGGELFAIFMGYVIANRGMRRLYELIDATKKITATSLHRRIAAKSWPTELRKLGKEFNEMLDRIESSFSHLTQFSDDLAHELRTPVNNLMGEMEIALSHHYTIAEYRQVLESNLEELHRISQIIENLLFLARTENPQLDLKKTLLNAHDEVAVLCEFYQAMADDKNIRLSCNGEAVLYANHVMFRRMISNLLSNALKYTLPGGEVTFSIKEIDSRKVEIALHDTGVGIDAEHLPKIVNRFYRVDSARSQYPGSTGLGLSIVKSIITLHRGTLTIDSVVGKGTSILVCFPK